MKTMKIGDRLVTADGVYTEVSGVDLDNDYFDIPGGGFGKISHFVYRNDSWIVPAIPQKVGRGFKHAGSTYSIVGFEDGDTIKVRVENPNTKKVTVFDPSSWKWDSTEMVWKDTRFIGIPEALFKVGDVVKLKGCLNHMVVTRVCADSLVVCWFDLAEGVSGSQFPESCLELVEG